MVRKSQFGKGRSPSVTYWELDTGDYEKLPQERCPREGNHEAHDGCIPVRYVDWYDNEVLYRVMDARSEEEELPIYVRFEEIEKSEWQSNSECFLAQGLKRRGDVVDVKVGNKVVFTMMSDDFVLRWMLPKEEWKARKHFDRMSAEYGAPVAAPGKWHLLPPSDSLRMGHKPKSRQGSDKRTGKTTNVLREEPTRPIVRI